jgi:hypothetical protein
VQSVLVEEYWDELQRGFAEHHLHVFHVVLDANESVLRARIAADQADREAEQWRIDHIAAYVSARSWMPASADLVIDTTDLTPADAASLILEALK